MQTFFTRRYGLTFKYDVIVYETFYIPPHVKIYSIFMRNIFVESFMNFLSEIGTQNMQERLCTVLYA